MQRVFILSILKSSTFFCTYLQVVNKRRLTSSDVFSTKFYADLSVGSECLVRLLDVLDHTDRLRKNCNNNDFTAFYFKLVNFNVLKILL